MQTERRPIDPAHAFLPAEDAPAWAALGFTLSRRPYLERVHFARRGTEDWSVDLARGLAVRWGETRWRSPQDLQPAAPAAGVAAECGGVLPQPPAEDFVTACIVAGFVHDGPHERGTVDLGNRWLRWRDGRRFLAVVSSRTLLARGFSEHRLEELSAGPAVAPPPPRRLELPPPRPVEHSGRSRQTSLW